MQPIIIIPCFNAGESVRTVARAAVAHGRVVVVNDGSTDPETLTALDALRKEVPVLDHEQNRGKGAALRTAFDWIAVNEPDASLVVTLDADGQHEPAEIVRFLDVHGKTGAGLVIGKRTKGTTAAPLIRSMGHRLVRWGMRVAARTAVPDSQCGFRLYDRSQVASIIAEIHEPGYEWETRVIVECIAGGICVESTEVSRTYTEYSSSRSHFRHVRDTLKIGRVITRHLLNTTHRPS